jgi:hypothetical protein
MALCQLVSSGYIQAFFYGSVLYKVAKTSPIQPETPTFISYFFDAGFVARARLNHLGQGL